MSREEVAAVLRNLQLSLDGVQRDLERAVRRLPETKRDELPTVLADARRKLARAHAEQLRELEEFAEEAGMQLEQAEGAAAAAAGDSPSAAAAGGGGAAEGGTPGLRSLERRVASMGGIPALGACVLPRMTPGMRPQLATTASPAAVEILRGRLGATDADATPLKHVGGQAATHTNTPLVRLRATLAPSGSGAGAGKSPAAAPDTELAAAMRRRMERLASASPDKGDASAAVQAAGGGSGSSSGGGAMPVHCSS